MATWGEAVAYRHRMNWRDYIEERTDVMLGKPVFKGTRLTVEHILWELGTGMSYDELLDNYPTLKPEHLQAAMLYAAAVLTMDETSDRERHEVLRGRESGRHGCESCPMAA
ncbi:MAG: DUF433 domain-containing protein [Pirellulales bacterium]|nr:DUF433 domain-containing protein [Pirellulales bacterium]